MVLDKAAERANAGGMTLGGRWRLFWGAIGDFFGAIFGGIGKGIAAVFIGIWRGIRFVGHVITETWDFLIRNLRIEFALAAGLGISAFEITRAQDGWDRLFAGTPDIILWVGATAIIAGGAVCVRMAAESYRAKEAEEPKKGWNAAGIYVWGIGALIAGLLALSGVWGSVASKAVETTREADESRTELSRLVQERDQLLIDLKVSNVAFYEAAILQQHRYLESLEATARGAYDMDELTVEACDAKLSTGARRICNVANGGIDIYTTEQYPGVRNVIADLENSRELAVAAEQRLADLGPLIDNFEIKGGDEVREAMADIFGAADAGKARSILYLIFSAGLIYLSWRLIDWSLEEIEKKRAAARIKSGKAA